MPIDPSIIGRLDTRLPLAVQAVDTTKAIQGGLLTRSQFDKAKELRETKDVRNKLLEQQEKIGQQQIETGDIALETAQEIKNFESIHQGISDMEGFIRSGDLGGAENMLNERIAKGQAEGRDMSDSIRARDDLLNDMQSGMTAQEIQKKQYSELQADKAEVIDAINLRRGKLESATGVDSDTALKMQEAKFKQVRELRGDAEKISKTFKQTQEAYNRVNSVFETNESAKAAEADMRNALTSQQDDAGADALSVLESTEAFGDMALIFNYMKVLDPGSTVREGEFANAQNTAGIPDKVRNLRDQLLAGKRLQPNQREGIKNQVEGLYSTARKQNKKDLSKIIGQAEENELPLGQIVDLGEPEPDPAQVTDDELADAQQQPATPQPISVQEGTIISNGQQQLILRGGQWIPFQGQ